jgi:hypothetical protein
MENIKFILSLASLVILLRSDLRTVLPIALKTRTSLPNISQLIFDMPVELTSPEDNTDRILYWNKRSNPGISE